MWLLLDWGRLRGRDLQRLRYLARMMKRLPEDKERRTLRQTRLERRQTQEAELQYPSSTTRRARRHVGGGEKSERAVKGCEEAWVYRGD